MNKPILVLMMKIQFKVDLETVVGVDGYSCAGPFWVLGSMTSPDQQLRGVLTEKQHICSDLVKKTFPEHRFYRGTDSLKQQIQAGH